MLVQHVKQLGRQSQSSFCQVNVLILQCMNSIQFSLLARAYQQSRRLMYLNRRVAQVFEIHAA